MENVKNVKSLLSNKNKFKTFKSSYFLPQMAMSSFESTESTKPDGTDRKKPNEDTGQSNLKTNATSYRCNLYESTKIFANLLHIRSMAKKFPAENQPSTKFLRSDSNILTNNFQTKSELNESQNFSKKQLLRRDLLDSNFVKHWLSNDLDTLIKEYESVSTFENENRTEFNFMETNEVSLLAYYRLAMRAKSLLSDCEILYNKIESNAHLYDFSEKIKTNGYRSLLRMYDSYCRHLLMLVIFFKEKKNTEGWFQVKFNSYNPLPKLNNNLKEFQAWVIKLLLMPSLFRRQIISTQNEKILPPTYVLIPVYPA
jgi:hypothetical protein